MAKSRPIRYPSDERIAVDALFKLIPEAAKAEWMSDLDQLKRWYDEAILGQSMDYPAMFWPSFVECDGCVLLAARSPGSLIDFWLKPKEGDRQELEKDLNSTYIGDLFTGYPTEPTRDQVIWMARLLKRMWGWKLHVEFPHRPIRFAFDEAAQDVLHSYFTFYQDANT